MKAKVRLNARALTPLMGTDCFEWTQNHFNWSKPMQLSVQYFEKCFPGCFLKEKEQIQLSFKNPVKGKKHPYI
jgi:hypothetical protein